MVVGYYRYRCSATVFSALYILLSFQCVVTSFSNKARLKEENNVRRPIYVVAESENGEFKRQSELYTRHRRKLPTESNDQTNNLDDDVPLQEYQGVFGRPGVDFPVLSSIPVTKFNCRHVKNSNTGYYADTETHCQVFHVCDSGRKISFLCPNGTIFRQSHLICDWWFRVDCERSPELYEQSVQQLEADQNVHKQRVEAIASAMQNAVSNNRDAKELPMLPSPVSVAKLNENFNSESELPLRNDINGGNNLRNDVNGGNNLRNDVSGGNNLRNDVNGGNNLRNDMNRGNNLRNDINGGNNQRNTPKPSNRLNSQPQNQNYNAITSPPRTTSFGTETPTTNVRFVNSENTRPSSQSTGSFTYATTTYKPDVTPLIHNFLPNDGGDAFREQQVLAETASFAGNGNYPLQNYYYSMNFIQHPSKEDTNKAGFNEYSTYSSQPVETTQYQTESYTNIDDSLYRTTNFPGNDYRDFNIVNNVTENDNDTYALYYSSTNQASIPFSLQTTLANEIRPASPSLSSNASKPQVSEFILNSQSNSEDAGENPTEQNLPLLTNMTQEKFNQLFPKEEKQSDAGDQSNDTLFRGSDLASEHSSGIVQSNGQTSTQQSPPKIENLDSLQFKSSPDLRELAQVFSRALSAYLENPEQFRKILSEVRPTEPPSNEHVNGEASSIDDEVLAFSEDVGMRSSPTAQKTTAARNTFSVDQVTFTTPLPVKSTIKDPETFAEEINNFMFADPHSYLGYSESGEFNVNDTYYPTSQLPTNATTLPGVTITQFTVSPLIDFTQNTTRFSLPTYTAAASTATPAFNIPENSLYDDSKNLKYNPVPEVSQSLNEKEQFLTADTQSFVSRDNLLKYQNYNVPQNYRYTDAPQNYKSSPVNQLPNVSQQKYNSDFQTIKSSKNMQFGMRTTSVAKPPYISSRADFSTYTTPSNAITSRTFVTTKATTYHPQTPSSRFSTYHNPESSSPQYSTERDAKSLYNSDMYQNLSPDSGHFNETAKALINMMEEAKSNNVLRNQLVLLLVNDKGLPTENKSVKDMKSKLLKALLKPSADKNNVKNYKNENERISRTDTVSTRPPTPKSRKERVVVHKHKITTVSPTTEFQSKSTATNLQPTRSGRSTSKPVVVAAFTESPQLSDSDTRAVDLLKTLYMIASNNWAQ